MLTVDLEVKKKNVEQRFTAKLPENWRELNDSQWHLVARNYLHEVDDEELLAWMMDVPRPVVKLMDAYQRYCLAEGLEFLNSFTPEEKFFTRNVNGLVSPRPKLEGMTWGRFLFVISYYDAALLREASTPLSGTDTMDKCIACLYLPEGAEFDDKLIVERTAYVRLNLSQEQRVIISLQLRLVLEWLWKKYPVIFEKIERDASTTLSVTSIQEQKKQKLTDWVKIHESVVGDDIINEDRYARLPMHTVLRYISSKLKKNGRK